jgi:hypothetical protein
MTIDPSFYNMEGEPISAEEFAKLLLTMVDDQLVGIDGRRVALTQVGVLEVSTVLLGMNVNFEDEGPPIIFESIIFWETRTMYMERYTNKVAALAGHDQCVERARRRDFT